MGAPLVASPLDRRIALISGASRGIGRSIAMKLAAAGAKVAINYRVDAREAHEVVSAIEAKGGKALAVRADVADPDDVRSMLERVGDALGPVEILVNNAGVAKPLAPEAVSLATWDATFAVNLRAAFILSSAVLPSMRARRWGRLLFVSSTAARVGGIVGPHYAASKAGLEGLMRSYASLYAREGITSNAVAPALIETGMLAGNAKAVPDRIPVGRFGKADEVAAVVLAVAENPYVTGQTIQVNGGLFMT